MRVYFGVCGLGLGHVGRCIPIAEKLRDGGDEVLFSTYGEGSSYVRREGFPLREAPSIGYAVREDGGVDFRRTTVYPGIFSIFIFLRQLSAEIAFMKEFAPDFVVSDSRLSSIFAAKLLGIPAITLINLYRVRIPRERRFLRLAKLTDIGIMTVVGKGWELGEKILIPDFMPPYTLSFNNLNIPPSRENKIWHIGPVLPMDYSQLPSIEDIRAKLGVINSNLILMPISGPIKEKEYLLSLMRSLLGDLPKKYEVIMSCGEPDSTVKPLRDGNITIYNWLPNFFEVLKACDLVISRSGLGIITQSLSFGKPMVLIPTPSHTEQFNNAKRAESLGVAKIIDQKMLTRNNLTLAIDEILTGNYSERAGEIHRESLNYNAIETVIKTLKSL